MNYVTVIRVHSPARLFFWPCLAACGILVPRPGIEPRAMAVKAPSPYHWLAREFPQKLFFLSLFLPHLLPFFLSLSLPSFSPPFLPPSLPLSLSLSFFLSWVSQVFMHEGGGTAACQHNVPRSHNTARPVSHPWEAG